LSDFTVCRCSDPARAAEIHTLTLDAFRPQPTDPPSSVLRETVADFAARLQAQTAFVAEAGGAVIGSVFCEVDGDALYFGRLAVRDDWRRRGVAGALVEAVKAEARARGVPAVTLKARIPMTGNVALFRKHGFEVTGEFAHAGYPAPTYYEMAWRA
jgi:predicted N-acetyltransferase YhbS